MMGGPGTRLALDIRQLAGDDATAYHALRLRMLREHPEAFTSSYEEDVDKPLAWVVSRLDGSSEGSSRDFVLGALRNGSQLVGSIGISVEPRVKQRHKGHLYGMFVAPEFAGRGVGRALLETAIRRARGIPRLEQINLTVTAGNARAVRMYEAAGFRSFGVEERALKLGDTYHAKRHMVLFLGEDPRARG